MRRAPCRPLVVAVALGFVALSPHLAAGPSAAQEQTLGKRAPLRPITSIDGKDLYKAYCEQCHGSAGKGDGPVAVTLKKPPTDLTQLATRNNGKFNRTAVEAFIRGDRPGGVVRTDKGTWGPVIVNADGTLDEMPIYGILFHRLWPEAPVTIRTMNLAKYLESIQAK